MQIKNDYEIFWFKTNGELEIDEIDEFDEKNRIDGISGSGIFNGELGTITKISNRERIMVVEFDDGKIAKYDYDNLEELELAYSITIHKAQGSEFDAVIMVIPNGYKKLLTRNLLYTGMTRAKKMLVMLGGRETIEDMIDNPEIVKRNTGLKERLKIG